MIELKLEGYSYSMKTEYGELSISPDSEYGFRPFQLMIASIAGCSLAALKTVISRMRLDFSDMKVSVEIERNEKEANRIEKIHLHFSINGKNLLQEKIEKAGVIARKHCSMVQSVQDSIHVTESFEIINDSKKMFNDK